MALNMVTGPAGVLQVNEADWTMDLASSLRQGSVQWSTGAVSEVRLSFEDRRRQIIGSGLVWPGRADGSRVGSIITVGTSRFETRAIEHSPDGTLVVQARSELACALKRAVGVAVAASCSPTTWIGRAVTAAGGRFHGQDCPVRDQITRQEKESDWDVAQRLASEEGFICYEVDGVVSFGKPSWLVKRPGYNVLNVDITTDASTGLPRPVEPAILTRPAPRLSADAAAAVCEWSIDVIPSFAMGIATVGIGAVLSGYYPFNGTYLLTEMNVPLLDTGTAQISAATPVDPVPAPPNPTGTGTGATSRGPISSPGAGKFAGIALNAEQVAMATAIVRQGMAMNVPTKGLVIAIAAAMQESTLRNLAYGDRDSLGLFQQRPSQGWGSPAQVRDPAYAARKFFETLLKVPGWASLSVAAAAQKVQRSAYPSAYARWEAMAVALVNAILATAVITTPTGRAGSATTATPTKAAAVIAAARAKIGGPYVWGGNGPSGYDCSGLMVHAFRAGVGFTLPRTTWAMLADARLGKVAQNALRPGDLWFPHDGHVGLVTGPGRVVEAQKPGTKIQEGNMWGWYQGRRVPGV